MREIQQFMIIYAGYGEHGNTGILLSLSKFVFPMHWWHRLSYFSAWQVLRLHLHWSAQLAEYCILMRVLVFFHDYMMWMDKILHQLVTIGNCEALWMQLSKEV